MPIRQDLDKIACDHGFDFHVIDNEIYCRMKAGPTVYITRQIEEQIEKPTAELHQMCLEIVERAVRDEQIMQQLAIPPLYWDVIAESWRMRSFALRADGFRLVRQKIEDQIAGIQCRIHRRRSMSPPTFNGYGWRMSVVAAPSRVMPINTTRYGSG